MNPVMEESPFFLQLTNDGVPRGATGFFVGVVGFVSAATFFTGPGGGVVGDGAGGDGDGRDADDEEGTEAFLGARKYLKQNGIWLRHTIGKIAIVKWSKK